MTPTAPKRPRAKPGPGSCQVCRSEHLHAINLALTYGQSVRSVAEQFGIHHDAVRRHLKNHLSPSQQAALLTASKPSEVDVEKLTRQESQGLLVALVAMRARLAAHAQACAAMGDHKGAIHAERVTLADLELTAKLVGQLISRSEVTVQHLTLTPSHLRLRQVLVEVLRPHPEIAAKVAAALAAIETDDAAEITAKAQPLTIEHEPEEPNHGQAT
jgi:transposase-like protein